MVGTISNIQVADIKSKLHCKQSFRDFIDRLIGDRLYPTSGSKHYKIICLDMLHGYTHEQAPPNGNHNKNNEINNV